MRRPQISLALLRLIVLTIVVVGAAVTVLVVGTDGLGDLLESAADSRLGIAAFMGLYIAGVVLMVPGTLGTFTSGAVLGFAVGFPVAVVAALIGATIAFFVSRLVGKEGMNELLGDRLTSIDDWLMDNDFVSILILRLMPVVPFNGLNYAAGLTSVRTSRYILASAIGIAPGTALSTFVAANSNDMTGTPFIVASIVLVLVIVGSTLFARRFMKTRRAAQNNPQTP